MMWNGVDRQPPVDAVADGTDEGMLLPTTVEGVADARGHLVPAEIPRTDPYGGTGRIGRTRDGSPERPASRSVRGTMIATPVSRT
jgi:hypothetical protein